MSEPCQECKHEKERKRLNARAAKAIMGYTLDKICCGECLHIRHYGGDFGGQHRHYCEKGSFGVQAKARCKYFESKKEQS